MFKITEVLGIIIDFVNKILILSESNFEIMRSCFFFYLKQSFPHKTTNEPKYTINGFPAFNNFYYKNINYFISMIVLNALSGKYTVKSIFYYMDIDIHYLLINHVYQYKI
jgi:hypothetical protein